MVNRSELTVNGRKGAKIERWWLIFFWIVIGLRLVGIAFVTAGPVFPEQDPIVARMGVAAVACFWVFVWFSVFYSFGYAKGGTKMLLVSQAMMVLGLLKGLGFVAKEESIVIGLLGWAIEATVVVFFIIWTGRLISLNRELKKSIPVGV